MWIRAPKGVHTLMNPMAWTIIDDAFTSTGLSILQWICLPHYVPPASQLGIIDRLKACGIQRGWNYFCSHFDEIMSILFAERFMRKTGSNGKEYQAAVWAFIQQYRHLLFTKVLPIPNKIALVTEKTPVGTYADARMASAIDAALSIASLDENDEGTSQQVRENRAIQAVIQLAEYYQNHWKNVIGKKEGWFRKHVFGTRIPYSGRTVITSLSCRHDYDELHIPWTFAIALLRVHITNKLLRRGFDPNAANSFIVSCAHRYDELMDTILKELIAEGPGGSLYCIFHRNRMIN